MADGSLMEGPDQLAQATLQFTNSTCPDHWHDHDFQVHKGEDGPVIIGNDFWKQRRAVIDYEQNCIVLKSDQGIEQIPFECAENNEPLAAAATTTPTTERWPVRATEDLYLQPNDGCVVCPTIDAPRGSLHCTSHLKLDPQH